MVSTAEGSQIYVNVAFKGHVGTVHASFMDILPAIKGLMAVSGTGVDWAAPFTFVFNIAGCHTADLSNGVDYPMK